MIIDSYITLAEACVGEYKEKGSKFIAYGYPFDDESELEVILGELKAIHPKARHYCFAYKIGVDNNRYRTNDDGEPSGTAGKPIYGQILSNGLTNIAIVVIRYFGGTKLGASGLIHAYKEATKSPKSPDRRSRSGSVGSKRSRSRVPVVAPTSTMILADLNAHSLLVLSSPFKIMSLQFQSIPA